MVTGAACGGGDRAGRAGGAPAGGRVSRRSAGAGQSAIAGTTLPVPYTVRVTDEAAQPVAGATVRWTRVAGTGSPLRRIEHHRCRRVEHRCVHTLGPAPGARLSRPRLSGDAAATPVVFSTTAVAAAPAVRVAEVPIPANYGIHDTFVRDGLAFVCAWNTGLIIYDVGHGIRGGSPSAPVEVSRIVPPLPGPVSRHCRLHPQRLVVPQSGARREALCVPRPGRTRRHRRLVTAATSIVVDVSDLAHRAWWRAFGMAGAGTHNFWMDEPAQVLYAAYYNGGVVAIDVSGVLAGDLAARLIAQVRPGGSDSTYTWGVQARQRVRLRERHGDGVLAACTCCRRLAVLGGGQNVLERWTSDLWVQGAYAFTGTWGDVARRQHRQPERREMRSRSGRCSPRGTRC